MDRIEMHPRVSVNGISSMGWTLEQDIAFYRSAGIGTIGVPFFKFDTDAAAGIQAIQQAGLRASSLVAATVGASFIASRHEGRAVALEILKSSIDAAKALDCPSCYFTAGDTPPRMPTDDAYNALVPALALVNAYAHANGIRLAIENNSTSTRENGFIHTLADAADLARDADIGICLELQNCWLERHLDRLFRANVERFVVVQVSDFSVGEAARLNRRVPGDGSMPLEWMLERLLEAGYGGLFEIEVLGPKIETEGYPSAIRRSIDWLSQRLRSWGA